MTWNQSEFNRILQVDTVPKALARAAGKTRDRAKMNLTKAGRVDKGALRNSITAQQVSSSGRVITWSVGSSLSYAILQHEGVRGPVLPRRAKVLRFVPKGGKQYVFARRTSGFSGVPYLTDALNSIGISDFTR